MEPDPAVEQPCLLQEQTPQDQVLAMSRDDDVVVAAEPDATTHANPRKHEHPEEPQLEDTAKRTKLSSDNEMLTGKSTIISMEDYNDMSGIIGNLQEAFTEKQQKIDAMREDNENTNLELANVYKILESMRTDLLAKTQAIEAEQKNHMATKRELSKRKEEIDSRLRSSRRKTEQLAAKDQAIETARVEMDETKRERNSAKRQAHDSRNALAEAQEKLNTKGQELDNVKSQLVHLKRRVDALQEVLDGNGAHNTKLKSDADRAKSSLINERKGYKKQKTELQNQVAKLEDRLQTLRGDLKTKQSEWEEQKNKMVTDLRELRGKNHRYPTKVPDQKVREVFGELTFKISQFVNDYLGQFPGAIDRQLEPVWEELTPHAREFLDSCVLQNPMFQSYIWEWLHRTVFIPNSKVWAGDLGTWSSKVLSMAQSQTNSYEDDEYADTQYWRSSTSNLLVRLTKKSRTSESCRPYVQDLTQSLSKLYDNFNVQDATTDAIDIFNLARDLDLTLRTLKAQFSFGWEIRKPNPDNIASSRFGFNFINGTMTDIIPLPSNDVAAQASSVDFIVSPALLKRGNNDGADYKTINCCIKMKVVCSASRFCQPAKSLIDTQAGAPQEEDVKMEAIQDIKEEDADKVVIHAHSQSRFTPVVSAPGRKKNGSVGPGRVTPIEIKVPSKTDLSPGQKPGTADIAGSRANAGGSKVKKPRKRRKLSSDGGDDSDGDPDDEDYYPQRTG